MAVEREGRVALITGGAGGLGSTVVEGFEDAGHRVVREDSADGESRLEWFDVTDPGSAADAVRTIIDGYGRIDVLVNLVGGWRPQPPIAEIDDETWDGLLNINLKSTFVMSRAVLPHMIERGSGRVINIGAGQGERGTANNGPYAVAKAGVLALTEVMAAETLGAGVTVNALVPSVIDTPGNRAAMPDADFSAWVPPAHLSATILFLCSDEAASTSGERSHVLNRS
jgi:NAD(P)-dependent dehydrogenase (short-subunit alcohol dehydrogenase family)